MIDTLEAFLEACAAWTPEGDDFGLIVTWALFNVVSRAELAGELEIPSSVIMDWAQGESRPRPQVQAFVIATLKRRGEVKKGAKA